ncbi:MAG TPA: M20/M25/M40 family metallo-hydrolase, partial [Methylomirabilota bacterium]|nr:M20/M25/M40 family metallo-hydrolase [Methylomirabilota bacterium]
MTDHIIALAKKFISIPSDVNDRDMCLTILETAQEELKKFSFTPFVKDGIPSMLYVNTKEPTKNCKIIFNAHLDVVPGMREQFTPYERNNRLYGRGAYDMKSAAAA